MKLQKETESPDTHGKWYGDACGTAFAMAASCASGVFGTDASTSPAGCVPGIFAKSAGSADGAT